MKKILYGLPSGDDEQKAALRDGLLTGKNRTIADAH